MRYSETHPNVAHRDIDLSDPDQSAAFWTMHHATIAFLDMPYTGNNERRKELRGIIDMAHERIDVLTAFQFT